MPETTSPIADLSYRNYDGPLQPPRDRWWVVARLATKLAWRKKSYWVFTLISGWYFLVMMAFIFIVEKMAEAQGPQANNITQLLKSLSWRDQFLLGFSYAQMMMLAVTLLVGAGAIANDNRANALLVYLSKPCTKRDYLFGKWAGIFIPLTVATGIPALVFYLYGALSYRAYGFLSEDPWLWLKLLILIPLASAFHASLVTGISSLFNQGRMAGATYAGLYFFTNFFTVLMGTGWAIAHMHDGPGPSASQSSIFGSLYYASIDGLNIGLGKVILGSDGAIPFGIRERNFVAVPAPTGWIVLATIVAISALSVWIAWKRIRAVEVVQ